ncbi:MAG: hypothetical protein JSR37_01695 [Verrucomicrobia bacterium]|nr:hypothetical protein [Verrucomicrobiota bacterium]MBS0636141.1 hypothetical protein [Verrucomicrobiota bacterium]
MMYLAQGYNALHAYAQENIFTTPQRQRIVYIAAGACAIVAVTAPHFTPSYLDELNRRMSLCCLRSVASLAETFPQSLQSCNNATHIFKVLPQSSEGCLALMGKFVAGAFVGVAARFFMEKAGLFDWLKDSTKQKKD